MGFLDKAKKLAQQAAVKADPLIDKAAPHAGKVVDKAGAQIDKRTGGKYRDKIDAAGAKVGEFTEKRAARRDVEPGPGDGMPPVPPPAPPAPPVVPPTGPVAP